MTETSYNGWPASRDRAAVHLVPLVVAGVEFVPGVRSGDVHTVLGYVAQQFHDRVEKLVSPGCWGYFYRQNRNAANLSCHSSGTAIDCNAPQHPNGIEARENYTPAQIREIHQILAEVPELDKVVHWGGDWHHPLTPDPMHFEIHDHDLPKLRRVAEHIRNQEDDMPLNDADKKWLQNTIRDEVRAVAGDVVKDDNAKGGRIWMAHALSEILDLARATAKKVGA